MDRRNLRLVLALAAVSCGLLLACAFGLVGASLLHVGPLALLLLPLLAGRYLGEDSIHRLAARRAPRRTRRPVVAFVPRAATPMAGTVRGGLLLASSLAKRPPPALALS